MDPGRVGPGRGVLDVGISCEPLVVVGNPVQAVGVADVCGAGGEALAHPGGAADGGLARCGRVGYGLCRGRRDDAYSDPLAVFPVEVDAGPLEALLT